MEKRGLMREKTNLPLPDRLKAVRVQIKELQEQESELAAEVREAGKVEGAFFEAYCDYRKHKRFLKKEAIEEFGERLDPFFEEKNVTLVKLREIE